MENYQKQKIIILGSTGSIGQQSLNVCRRLDFEVVGLSCSANIDLLLEQIKEFKPRKVAVANYYSAVELAERIKSIPQINTEILYGEQGNVELAKSACDKIVVAIIGFAALKPLLAAIEAKHTIALANKETIVSTGKFVLERAEKYGAKIYPVDSEASAIWQCLTGKKHENEEVKQVWLTASGGPFHTYGKEQFNSITVEDALNHPVWSMGKKITIDSASMMNKGLELIEICRLFNLTGNQIKVIIHPQSIVHSMVEYVDGSVIAQLSMPNMELPIQYALTYDKRIAMPDKPKLNFTELGQLTFEAPDMERFPALRLAYEAQAEDGAMPAVLNAANEIAVQAFLQRKISFVDISETVELTMKKFRHHHLYRSVILNDILAADQWAREYTDHIIARAG
ncbi:MAG TPA: 1-deoxy-D-xylulose-5-phosphate reductoisomerase [Clostridiaceae bacterium]|nr:1-deoxy-D-xylulose-5-phosphate reductoisomerase [Clostridiaceae bacterium]